MTFDRATEALAIFKLNIDAGTFKTPWSQATVKASTTNYVDRYSLVRRKKVSTEKFRRCVLSAFFLSTGLVAGGCGQLPDVAADAQSESQGAESSQSSKAVDIAIARTGKLGEGIEYTGTTAPVREVSLRSQVEGQVLSLSVDVGDAVKQGQIIAQLDDDLLTTALNQAKAQLATLKSEVARAQNQVSNARAQVERARLELQQARADSARQQQLVGEGAIATQEAEQARTAARTAAQALRAAQEQVGTEQQAVAAAQGQVTAQQAVVAQAQERLSYSKLISPLTGVVLQRVTEEGNFLQPNGEIFRLGDFSRVEVVVQVSELELSKIRLRQSVKVRLDAFPNQTFSGQVSRISPAADSTARLVPVEVIIPNSNGEIGSGLLARVSFEGGASQRVVVAETAVSEQVGRGEGEQGRNGTVFVVTGGEGGTQATVVARSVTLGERADGQVEILSGLRAGERFVVRSSKPLKTGEPVRLSVLSEVAKPGGKQ